MRKVVEDIEANPNLDATVIQTVGVKGWDEYSLLWGPWVVRVSAVVGRHHPRTPPLDRPHPLEGSLWVLRSLNLLLRSNRC